MILEVPMWAFVIMGSNYFVHKNYVAGWACYVGAWLAFAISLGFDAKVF